VEKNNGTIDFRLWTIEENGLQTTDYRQKTEEKTTDYRQKTEEKTTDYRLQKEEGTLDCRRLNSF